MYTAYKGLIIKEAHAVNVYAALGEDAENTAWEIFYSFIMEYEGKDFKHLPGLIKKQVHFRLLDKLHQRGTLYDCESMDASSDEDKTHQYADPADHIGETEIQLLVRDALGVLTQHQRDIIDDLYFQGLSLDECKTKHNCHRNNVYLHHRSALKRLRTTLN